MKEVEIFIGPCSKYITGQGWTTGVPVEQLKAKGWVKSEEIERLTEREKFLENAWKTSLEHMETVERGLKASEARTAEFQKQVDELTDKLGKVLSGIKADELLVAKGIEQAVKDTAKEILHLIKSSEYVDSLKTISIWAVEKIFKERYGVEVEG